MRSIGASESEVSGAQRPLASTRKNLGAYGEGGALVTNDPHIAEFARVMR